MAVSRTLDDGFNTTRAALVWWTARNRPSTSSLTGSGAIAELESYLGRLLGGWALALPSGSAAITTGLRAFGIRPGDTVAMAGASWFGGPGLVRSLGATPMLAAVPHRARVLLTTDIDQEPVLHPSTAVLVDASGHQPEKLVELGNSATWDAVAVSFGPSKPIDAGEGGAVVFRRRGTWRRAVAATQHPLRQRLNGVECVCDDGPGLRIHPVAAVNALYQLTKLALAGSEAPPNNDATPVNQTTMAG